MAINNANLEHSLGELGCQAQDAKVVAGTVRLLALPHAHVRA